ncbi:MAG: DUF4097 domain-containing protein [Clostridia bacterium]|nr:DUF4097 domain-containing protein [Clostridia bacterium]
MKNRGFIIALIILLLLIIAGLIWFLIICLTGSFNFMNGFRSFGRRSTNIVFDETYKIEDINNIEIISKAGDITFEESEDDNIRVVAYAKNSSDVKVNLNKSKLKVENSVSSKGWFNFNFDINDIIVYIPEDYSNEINLRSNYGDCKITSLEEASIIVDSDCGNIDLGDVKNATIKSDYGDIKINTIFNKCNINSACGDIKVYSVQIQENSSIKSDFGDVKINNSNDIYVDTNVDLGDVKIRNNNRYSDITLKIDSSCGDIKVGD